MATGASPPKPWERAAGSSTSSAAVPSSISTATAATPATSTSVDAPTLPARPDSLSTLAARNASAYSSPYSRPGYSSYGMSSYSSPYSSFSSPFNRFGGGGMGYGGGMYGGGYGGMGYGGGMYGQPGPGQGMYGPNGQDASLTQTYQQSTQATFQMIESIVGAFGGFAQMLESTYMATHSSFFAMVSVAEQFGTLRQTLGSVLGIFTLMRWIRMAIAKITGRPPPASPTDLTPANFAAFNGTPGPDGAAPGQPRPSRKPFIFFVVAVFGLPYLMTKLIRALAASQEAEQQRQLAANPHAAEEQAPLDPSKLDFCRVLYDYTPQTQPGQQLQDGVDLAVRKGDLVAVLSKADPTGQPSDWWRCRTRDGHLGYLPSPYLETIPRKPATAQIAANSHPPSPDGSRLHTMTGSSRANSMKIGADKVGTRAEKEKVEIKQKQPSSFRPMDGSVESFQRGAFNP